MIFHTNAAGRRRQESERAINEEAALGKKYDSLSWQVLHGASGSEQDAGRNGRGKQTAFAEVGRNSVPGTIRPAGVGAVAHYGMGGSCTSSWCRKARSSLA